MTCTRFLLILALGAACKAHAQQSGDNFLQIGVIHAQTMDSSSPLFTTLQPSGANNYLGISSAFQSPGTQVSVDSRTTLVITSTHFFNEHVAVKVEGGLPPIFKLYGKGTVAPTGPSGTVFNVDLGAPQNNPLASVREWSPVVLLQYYLLPSSSPVHPYFGFGVTYTFFTGVRLSPDFQKSLNTNLGAVLALEDGQTAPTSARAHASSAWAPVANVGTSIDLLPRLSLVASLSYVLLYTNARVDLTAADDRPLSTSVTRINLNTLATSLLLSVRL